jgi:hypothetical protein
MLVFLDRLAQRYGKAPSDWFDDLGPFARWTLDSHAAGAGSRQDAEDFKRGR